LLVGQSTFYQDFMKSLWSTRNSSWTTSDSPGPRWESLV